MLTIQRVLKLLGKANKMLKSFGSGHYLSMTRQRFIFTPVSLTEQCLSHLLQFLAKKKGAQKMVCAGNGA